MRCSRCRATSANTSRSGVGYNFTDFSDDLTDLSYDSKGFFLNLTGRALDAIERYDTRFAFEAGNCRPMRAQAWYSHFAKAASHFCGRPRTFALAVAVIVAWIVTGPMFRFSDTWQLVINTGTTIVTFLMVFLIQNTQNRDTEAIQVKLDELIRATSGAHNALLDLEELEEHELDGFRTKYEKLAAAARSELTRGVQDTGTPET